MSWHLTVGCNRELGGRAIPLRPRRFFVVSEVQSADDIASLPAAIARRIGAEERIAAVGRPQ
jgi:hypothetical protein